MEQKKSSGHGRTKLDEVDLREVERRVQAEAAESEAGKPDTTLQRATYYEPKSFDQLREDDQERRRMLTARLPKHAALRVASVMTLLFFMSIFFILSIDPLWRMGQAGVFFSFFGALVLVTVIIGCFTYLSRIFYLFGKSLRSFAVVYSLVFVISIIASAVLSSIFSSVLGGYLWLVVASVLHLALIWLVFRRILIA